MSIRHSIGLPSLQLTGMTGADHPAKGWAEPDERTLLNVFLTS